MLPALEANLDSNKLWSLTNASEENQWGMENVEFCTSALMITEIVQATR